MEKETSVENPPAPQTPPADPPPAAVTVINGKTERELQLEKDLQTALDGKKSAELTAAEKEDKLRQLIDLQKSQPAPTPAPAKAKKKSYIRFTLLHPRED